LSPVTTLRPKPQLVRAHPEELGPDFVNAGDYYVTLDAASMSPTQHF
jgi:hypothetical protein